MYICNLFLIGKVFENYIRSFGMECDVRNVYRSEKRMREKNKWYNI